MNVTGTQQMPDAAGIPFSEKTRWYTAQHCVTCSSMHDSVDLPAL